MDGNRCPICLREFDRRYDLRQHMKKVGHTIDGIKAISCTSDEARMAAYHREKANAPHTVVNRYGK